MSDPQQRKDLEEQARLAEMQEAHMQLSTEQRHLIEQLKQDKKAYHHVREIQRLLNEGTKETAQHAQRFSMRPSHANPLRKKENEKPESYDDRLNRQLNTLVGNNPQMRNALKYVIKAQSIPFLSLSKQQQNRIIIGVSQWLANQT